jgi:hypothetical protein
LLTPETPNLLRTPNTEGRRPRPALSDTALSPTQLGRSGLGEGVAGAYIAPPTVRKGGWSCGRRKGVLQLRGAHADGGGGTVHNIRARYSLGGVHRSTGASGGGRVVGAVVRIVPWQRQTRLYVHLTRTPYYPLPEELLTRVQTGA